MRHALSRHRAGLAALGAAALLAAAAPASANTKYASIVIDADTGQVLHARYADSTRYPASLTKMMTLYLMFEAIEAGELDWDDTLVTSQAAENARPSELGLKKGDTITVAEAARALVTKSANDVAIAVAEHMAGSEAKFAKDMTQRAKELGMKKTRFVNASGWPDTRQTSTARDLAILTERVMEDFPQYYNIFATPEFTWDGVTHKNHNNLLQKAKGVDGVKTGYTNASGFNVATSAERDGARVIAIVMGGRTARSRDAHMQELLNAAFAQIAKEAKKREHLIAELGAAESRILGPNERLELAGGPEATPVESGSASEAETGQEFEIAGVSGDIMYSTPPAAMTQGSTGDISLPGEWIAAETASPQGAWSVQVGAYLSASRAEERLEEIHSIAGWLLANAEPTVEPVRRDGKQLYRAQFRGLSEAHAQATCDDLVDLGQPCFALAMAQGGQ